MCLQMPVQIGLAFERLFAFLNGALEWPIVCMCLQMPVQIGLAFERLFAFLNGALEWPMV